MAQMLQLQTLGALDFRPARGVYPIPVQWMMMACCRPLHLKKTATGIFYGILGAPRVALCLGTLRNDLEEGMAHVFD